MKIVIYGAGATGCWIGGAWAAAGIDVSFIGREGIREEIAEHGLGVSDVDGWQAHLDPERIDYRTDPAALRHVDVIALTVKSSATEAAAGEIERHANPGATLISFQNGIGSAARLQRLLPVLQVVPGTIAHNVAHVGPGRWHKGTGGELFAARTPAIEALAAAIGDRSGRLVPSDDMAGVAWGKLLLNLNNAVNALSGVGLLEQLRRRDYRRVVAASMLETIELLDAAGIEPARIGPIPPKLMPHVIGAPDAIFNNLFLRIQKVDAKARSSMADDLAAGRATEIDQLNGEVVKLAASLGREAPVNAAMVTLVKQAEQERRKWGPGELRAAVLG